MPPDIESKMGLEPRQLNDLDESLLDLLVSDRSTPKLLRSQLRKEMGDGVPSAAYVNQRLRRLEEHEHLNNLEGTGVYELVDDPRSDGNDHSDGLEAKAIQRQHELEMEIEEKTEALQDCREALEDAREGRDDIPDLDRALAGVSAAITSLEGQAPDVDMARSELRRVEEVLEDGGRDG